MSLRNAAIMALPVVLALGAYAIRGASKPVPPPGAAPVVQPPPAAVAPLPSAVEELTRREVTAAVQRIETAPPTGTTAEATARGAVRRTFHEILSKRTMIYRDALEADLFDRLRDEPLAVAEVERTASDLAYAVAEHGEEQAEMRYLAVRFLRHLARRGDLEPLTRSLERLGETLNMHETWQKGIDVDYIELLAQYIRSVGVDAILRDPEDFVRRFGLTPRTVEPFAKAAHDSGLLVGEVALEFQRRVVPLIDPTLLTEVQP